MAGIAFVEILGSKDRVVERFRFDSLPFTIGRAYSNDMILDDPYVCPEHLRIVRDADGNLVAEDLGSVNGLRESNRPERVTSMRLHPGIKLRIGRTVLHFCDANHPVAATLVDQTDSPTFRSRLASPYAGGGFAVAAFALLAAYSYLGTYERVSVAKIVSQSLFILLGLGLWAGCWALVSRVVFGRSRYMSHLAVVCGLFVAYAIFDLGVEWFEFFFVAERAVWIAGVAGGTLFLAMLLSGHLRLASTMAGRTRRWWALGVGSAIVSLIVIAGYADRDKFTFLMEYPAVLKPVDARWLPAVSVEEFVNGSEELKTELDALAQKARRRQ
jgi:hypothetical protein